MALIELLRDNKNNPLANFTPVGFNGNGGSATARNIASTSNMPDGIYRVTSMFQNGNANGYHSIDCGTVNYSLSHQWANTSNNFDNVSHSFVMSVDKGVGNFITYVGVVNGYYGHMFSFEWLGELV